ncbi:MAG TPA: M20/M25/M40 family metallo-hydrolase [Thermoanaerobaculia bacterium]|nr:M20/M25/M40 family metallo-hydrolase [Thermoanaerobaculia bacterium]
MRARSLRWSAAGLLVGAVALAAPAALPSSARGPAETLRDSILAGSKAIDWVREITDAAGPRLPGTPGDRAGVAAAVALLRAQGFANVRAEKVMTPAWARGVETGQIVSPAPQPLSLTALGGSVPTPPEGLEAEIVRVGSMTELEALSPASVKGKIVFVDRPMTRTSDGSGYGGAALMRAIGASAAGRLGAVGFLIRSVGTDRNRLPHTGGMQYLKDAPQIPAAALSVPDADLLTRLVSRGGPVRVRFTLGCHAAPDAESANVIGDVVGREKPEEIVLLGAHIDSWDLGTGALDDAAGCGIVVEAARQIAALSPRPRRTVRVVLFANEENGLAGGKAYAADHAAELDRHVAAFEADLGQGPPLGFSWDAGPGAEKPLQAMAAVLSPIGADHLLAGDAGGADLTYLLPSGIPSLGLLLDATDYFDYHHTANDTFDKIDSRVLDRSTAALAAAAWVLADAPDVLERIPAAKRQLPYWAR